MFERARSSNSGEIVIHSKMIVYCNICQPGFIGILGFRKRSIKVQQKNMET